jgi:kinesin family protein C1
MSAAAERERRQTLLRVGKGDVFRTFVSTMVRGAQPQRQQQQEPQPQPLPQQQAGDDENAPPASAPADPTYQLRFERWREDKVRQKILGGKPQPPLADAAPSQPPPATRVAAAVASAKHPRPLPAPGEPVGIAAAAAKRARSLRSASVAGDAVADAAATRPARGRREGAASDAEAVAARKREVRAQALARALLQWSRRAHLDARTIAERRAEAADAERARLAGELEAAQRAAADRARLHDEAFVVLERQLAAEREAAAAAQAALTDAQCELLAATQAAERGAAEAAEQRARAAEAEAASEKLRFAAAEASEEGAALRAQLATLSAARESDRGEAEQLRAQTASLTRALRDERVRSEMQRDELDALRRALAEAEARAARLGDELAAVARAAADHGACEARFRALEQELAAAGAARAAESEALAREAQLLRAHVARESELRRRLHSELQSAKGTVRVFCRVRPCLPSGSIGGGGEAEAEAAAAAAVARMLVHERGAESNLSGGLLDELEVEAVSGRTVDGSADKVVRRRFAFDRVLWASAAQDAAFECVRELVDSALDGSHVTVFAYGQTGSGKTHTMFGPSLAPGDAARGVIPRAVEQLFAAAAQRAQLGWRTTLEASCLQIYNEEVSDLLAADAADGRCVVRAAPNVAAVANLTRVAVATAPQLYALLEAAAARRAVGRTACNETSSRSHTVCQVHIRSEPPERGRAALAAVLSLVDLAGSERLARSGAAGERLRETQAINASLSALAQCVAAVAARRPHVPFRNSKLTTVLQHALGPQGRTAFFVNVAPEAAHLGETLCTLRFAESLKECHLAARAQ